MIAAEHDDQLRGRIASVLRDLGAEAAFVTALPSRRPGRLVCRIRTAHGPVWYAKCFATRGTYARETNAVTALGPEIAPRVIATVEERRVLITEEIEGKLASGSGRERSRDIVRRCLPPFSAILTMPAGAPIDPIETPSSSHFDVDFACLATLARTTVPQLRAWLVRPQPLLPCHGDLTPNNVIIGPTGVRFIDFEYFGIGQPLHDAAGLCLSPSLDLDTAERTEALSRYAHAVARAAGEAVGFPTVAGAVVLWAVRFSARLRTRPTALDTHLDWADPLRTAGTVLEHLSGGMSAATFPSTPKEDRDDD